MTLDLQWQCIKLNPKPDLMDKVCGKLQKFDKLYEDFINRMKNTKLPSPVLTNIFHVIQNYAKFASYDYMTDDDQGREKIKVQ